MSYLGAAAGATLGFIADNTRGAYYGSRAGFRLRPWTMVPIPTKRRASRTLTAPYFKKARTGNSAFKPGTGSASSRGTRATPQSSSRFGVRRIKSSTRTRRFRSTKKGKSRSAPRLSNLSTYDAGSTSASYGTGPRAYPGFFKRGQFHSLVSTDTFRIETASAVQKWGVLPGAAFSDGTGAGALVTQKFLPGLSLMNYIGQDLLRDTSTQGTAFADAIGAVTNPGQLTQKFVVPMISLKHELKNQTSTAIHVSLYDLVLRDTTSSTPDPIADISNGLLQERTGYSNARNGATPENGLGVTPFQSSLFCKKWKVVKTTTLLIPPGSTHGHTFINKPKRMFSFDDDCQISTTGNTTVTGQGNIKPYQGYTTCCTIARIWGTPAHDATTKSTVFNSAAALDILTRCYIKYAQFIKNKRVHAIYSTQVPPATTAKVILKDTDAPSDVVFA